jgi:signal transduction histidine kinase
MQCRWRWHEYSARLSHEFDKTVGLLRDGLRRLKAWANANPDLADLYQDLRNSFDHLDEYLTLFTPLDRRAHRTKIEILGKQIFEFLQKLFGERFRRHKITFAATKEFDAASVTSYPSSIYPAFVNLVDNSIFWLQRNKAKRTITLDADAGDFFVLDNGPGVSARDRENIFALNFSRKPGGRGMGLHISRQSLAKVGLNLLLEQRKDYEGAIFRISGNEKTASRKGAK